MRQDPTIPVYLITGFLDGGKTNFLKYTMQEDYFNDGSKTLLILCEEGEEEYEPAMLKKCSAKLELIDSEEDFTEKTIQKLALKHRPERVIIEYNGMWSVKKALDLRLPKYWMIYQIITILDGENFGLYLNNIKMTAMEMLTNTDMVIFNRCKPDSDLVLYQRTLRSVNPKCDLVFEDDKGEPVECPEPDLPYDIKGDDIEISDENYGTFYIDLPEHPERYEGKRIHMCCQVMQSKDAPDPKVLVAGRRAMTCCEADIRFLPYLFIYDKARSIENRAFINVTATMKWEYHEAYQEKGPVFYVNELKLANRPADELIYF